MNNFIYPKTTQALKDLCLSNKNMERIYNKLGNITLFDVSLRDGLQSLSKDKHHYYNLENKKNIYHEIHFNYQPINFELGSIVSEKVLPIMNDSEKLYNYVYEHQSKLSKMFRTNNYLLVPNLNNLKKTLENTMCTNFSFITSVSNSFQIKNTNKNIDENKKEILEMLYFLDNMFYIKNDYNVKLYISCINECPIAGKLDKEYIVNQIMSYKNYHIDNICLSDTCGTLTSDDFEYIVDSCHNKGLSLSKLSLHLHVDNDKKDVIENIIHKALDRNITTFDVSFLNYGGCSVTMDNNKMLPNLSYELFYEFFINYMIKRV